MPHLTYPTHPTHPTYWTHPTYQTHPTYATYATYATYPTHPTHPAMKIAVVGGAGVRTPLLVEGLTGSDLPIEICRA